MLSTNLSVAALVALVDAEFAPNLEDALMHECVEFIECDPVHDTVPGSLAEYFREEGGWVH
jgi:hypothetical protein